MVKTWINNRLTKKECLLIIQQAFSIHMSAIQPV